MNRVFTHVSRPRPCDVEELTFVRVHQDCATAGRIDGYGAYPFLVHERVFSSINISLSISSEGRPASEARAYHTPKSPGAYHVF